MVWNYRLFSRPPAALWGTNVTGVVWKLKRNCTVGAQEGRADIVYFGSEEINEFTALRDCLVETYWHLWTDKVFDDSKELFGATWVINDVIENIQTSMEQSTCSRQNVGFENGTTILGRDQ